jgi:hypothetical protein
VNCWNVRLTFDYSLRDVTLFAGCAVFPIRHHGVTNTSLRSTRNGQCQTASTSRIRPLAPGECEKSAQVSSTARLGSKFILASFEMTSGSIRPIYSLASASVVERTRRLSWSLNIHRKKANSRLYLAFRCLSQMFWRNNACWQNRIVDGQCFIQTG